MFDFQKIVKRSDEIPQFTENLVFIEARNFNNKIEILFFLSQNVVNILRFFIFFLYEKGLILFLYSSKFTAIKKR